MRSAYEHINATLSLLGFCLLVVFGRYLLTEWVNYGLYRVRIRAAVSITVFVSGETLTRGWTWLGRRFADTGFDSSWMMEFPWVVVPIVGAAISGMGMLCMIRVFSPDEWGDRAWIVCAAIVTALVISGMLIR